MQLAQILAYILLIILGSYIMIEAVKAFVDASTGLAKHFGISSYTISFLVVGLGTSLPDIFVAVDAALLGKSELAYGSVVGASINLLAFVPAITTLVVHNLSAKKTFDSKDIHFGLIFAVMAQGLALDKTISRIDGFILVMAYIVYLLAFMKKSSPIESFFQRFGEAHLVKKAFVVLTSLGVILFVSNGIVDSAMHLSTLLNINLIIAGLIFTSFGTCLPDLVFAITSAKYKKDDAVMGDIVGSIIALNTFVLGIAAVVYPINIPDTLTVAISTGFLITAITLFFLFTNTKKRLDKKEAVVLILLYAIFLVKEFVGK